MQIFFYFFTPLFALFYLLNSQLFLQKFVISSNDIFDYMFVLFLKSCLLDCVSFFPIFPIRDSALNYPFTSSRSTFEFTSRVKLFGLSLYCIARTLGMLIKHQDQPVHATRLTRSDFMLHIGADLLLLKEHRCVF